MLAEALVVALVAAMLARLGVAPLLGWAPRWGLISRKPRTHDGAVPRGPLPCIGGVAVLGAMTIALGVWTRVTGASWEKGMAWIAVGTVAMMVLGLWDDRRPLSAGRLLLWQSLAALLMVLAGVRVSTVFLPSAVNDLVTVVWIVLITNALNMLDVVDGLAAGVATFAAAGFSIAGAMTGNLHAAMVGAGLAGGLVGFLAVNFYPATAYLGNHGSLAIGFLLSTLALAISYAPLGREMALAAPLLILGVLLFDVGFVMVMRWCEGHPIWRGSDDHLALRLIRLGWAERDVVLFLYGCSFVFVIAGLSLIRFSNLWGFVMFVAAIATVGGAAARACRFPRHADRSV